MATGIRFMNMNIVAFLGSARAFFFLLKVFLLLFFFFLTRLGGHGHTLHGHGSVLWHREALLLFGKVLEKANLHCLGFRV